MVGGVGVEANIHMYADTYTPLKQKYLYPSTGMMIFLAPRTQLFFPYQDASILIGAFLSRPLPSVVPEGMSCGDFYEAAARDGGGEGAQQGGKLEEIRDALSYKVNIFATPAVDDHDAIPTASCALHRPPPLSYLYLYQFTVSVCVCRTTAVRAYGRGRQTTLRNLAVVRIRSRAAAVKDGG